jgi:hypothetical protein
MLPAARPGDALRSSRWSTVAAHPVGWLLLALVAVWWPVLGGGFTLARSPLAATVHPEVIEAQLGWPVNDSLASAQQDEAWLAHLARSLRAGDWPLFNPYNGAGAPFLESLQPGVLYPLNLLLVLLPADSPWLFDLFSLAHVAIFLVGLWTLYRRYAPSEIAAGLAILVGLSGLTYQNVNMVHYRGLVWFPWMLSTLLTVTLNRDRRGEWRSLVAFLAAGLCALTAGNLQDFVVSLGVTTVTATFVGLHERRVSRGVGQPTTPWPILVVRPSVLALALVALGAGVWFPYVRGIASGDLASVADPTRCLEGVPLKWMLSWLLPHWEGFFPTQLAERRFWFLPQPDLPTSLTLVVLLAGLVLWRETRTHDRRLFIGLLTIVGLLLLKTVETPLFDWLVHIPLLNGIKFHKYNSSAAVLMGLIAALGLGRLSTCDPLLRTRLVTRALGGLTVAVALLLLALHLDKSWSLKHPSDRAASLFIIRSFSVVFATAGVTALVLVRAPATWGRRLALLWAVQAVWLLPPGWLPRLDRYENPWSYQRGASQDRANGPARILSPLPANSGLHFREEHVDLFDPVLNRRWKAFYNRLFTARYPDFALVQTGAPTAAQVPALALAGVDEVQGYPPPAGSDVTPLGPGRWQPRLVLPQAFLIDEETFGRCNRLWAEAGPNHVEEILRLLDTSRHQRSNASVTVQSLSARRFEIQIGPREQPARLVWLRAFHSAWSCRASNSQENDTRQAALEPFLDTFLSTRLEPGDPVTLQFDYGRRDWWWAAVVGMLAATVLLGTELAVAGGLRRTALLVVPQFPSRLVDHESNAVSFDGRELRASIALLALTVVVARGTEPLRVVEPRSLQSLEQRLPGTNSEEPAANWSVTLDLVADIPFTTGTTLTLPASRRRVPLLIRGLAGDRASKKPPDRVWIQAGDRVWPAVTGVLRLERPPALAAPEFGRAGFLASLDASGWTTTPTELVLWCEADGQLTRHATGLFLQTESLPPPRK